MTTRFYRARWSTTRQEIDRMTAGQTITFPRSEYFNCNASVSRLNDAYDGERVWTLRKLTTVTRIK